MPFRASRVPPTHSSSSTINVHQYNGAMSSLTEFQRTKVFVDYVSQRVES